MQVCPPLASSYSSQLVPFACFLVFLQTPATLVTFMAYSALYPSLCNMKRLIALLLTRPPFLYWMQHHRKIPLPQHSVRLSQQFATTLNNLGRRGDLMVSVLNSESSGPVLSPDRENCIVFLGKTRYSQCLPPPRCKNGHRGI